MIGVFSAGYFDSSKSLIDSSLLIPFEVFILACATAVVSALGYALHLSQKPSHVVSILSYSLLGATISYLVVVTGGTSSPFIALWMLIAVFVGLFSTIGIAIAFLAVNGYLFALVWFGGMPEKDELVVFALAGELPVLISYFIWHSKKKTENDTDKAFSALAAQLSEVADKSQIVINAIADGVMAIDNTGVIQLINPAAQSLLGWTQGDALTLDYKSVLKLGNKKGEPFEDAVNPIQQVLTTNQTFVNNDITLMTNSGKQIIVSLLVSPAGTHGSGAIIVFRDITNQKKEERQQAEFISTASHEMRTPVAAIEGYLGLALNPATAAIDEKARQYLTKAHESAQHLGRLFQDLLDVSKVEDGRISNNPGIIDVVAFAGDVITGLEVRAKEKGLMLFYKPGLPGDTGNDLNKKISPVFYVNADADHLREVLSNLTENAIKYTPQGSVTIDVTGDESLVTVSIHDSGIGIPPEDVGHLFQKFYRVDNSATREIGGTGLGLYLCRRLVETMNGKIWVESEFGKGSTFFVQFARISHEEAMAQLEASAAEAQDVQNRTIQTSTAARLTEQVPQEIPATQEYQAPQTPQTAQPMQPQQQQAVTTVATPQPAAYYDAASTPQAIAQTPQQATAVYYDSAPAPQVAAAPASYSDPAATQTAVAQQATYPPPAADYQQGQPQQQYQPQPPVQQNQT